MTYKILANVIPEDLFRKSLKLLPEKSFYDIEIDKGLIRIMDFHQMKIQINI